MLDTFQSAAVQQSGRTFGAWVIVTLSRPSKWRSPNQEDGKVILAAR